MYLVIILGPIFTLFLSCFFFNKFPQRFMFGLFFTSLIISLICSVFIVYEVVYLNSFCLIEITTWFKLGLLNVHWSFYFDKLSTLLLFLIIPTENGNLEVINSPFFVVTSPTYFPLVLNVCLKFNVPLG